MLGMRNCYCNLQYIENLVSLRYCKSEVIGSVEIIISFEIN